MADDRPGDPTAKPPHSGAATPPGPGWLLVCPARHRGGLVLSVVGEADMSTAAQLRNQLLASLAFAPTSVLVDLTGLDFCGLAGLDALHAFQAAARRQRVAVRLQGPSRQLSWLQRTFPPTAPSGALPPPPGLNDVVTGGARATGDGQDARRGGMIKSSPAGTKGEQ